MHAPAQVADKLAGVLERAVQAVDAQEEAQAGAGEQCQHEAPGGSKWEQPTAAGPGGSRWGAQPAAAGTSPGGEGGAEVFEAAASVMDLRQVSLAFSCQFQRGTEREEVYRVARSFHTVQQQACPCVPGCPLLLSSPCRPAIALQGAFLPVVQLFEGVGK